MDLVLVTTAGALLVLCLLSWVWARGAVSDGPALSGDDAGLSYRVDVCRDRRVVIEIGPLDQSLRVLPTERALGALHTPVLTGDDAFDFKVRVQGDRTAVMATFDDDTRQALASSRDRYDLTVVDSKMSLTVPKWVADRGEHEVLEILRHHLRLARGLMTPPEESIAARLAENAIGSKQAAFRLHCLELLFEKFGASPEAADAAQRALRDPSGRARLAAAMHLGESAVDEVVEPLIFAQSEPSTVRYLALRYFVRVRPESVGVLHEVLDSGDPGLIKVGLQRLRELGRSPSVDRMLDCALKSEGKASLPFFHALGATVTPDDERRILGALSKVDLLSIKACQLVFLLTRIGGRASLPVLAKLGRVRNAPDLRGVAGRVSDQIRHRLGLEEGSLSMIEPASGGSVTFADEGAVSYAGED